MLQSVAKRLNTNNNTTFTLKDILVLHSEQYGHPKGQIHINKCYIDLGFSLPIVHPGLWLYGPQQTGKFLKRWEYQTTWPASWEICMQVRKQQLELDMEQTSSK